MGSRGTSVATPFLLTPSGSCGNKKAPWVGFPLGILRSNWNDAEKVSMAPAQG